MFSFIYVSCKLSSVAYSYQCTLFLRACFLKCVTPWPTWRFNKCDGPCGSLPNYSQIFQVKTTNIYYLTVSMDQKSGHSLPWCPCLEIANKSPRLQSHPWVWQKEDQLPSIFTPFWGIQCLMSCRIEGPSYFLNVGQRPLSFLP